MKGSTVPTRRSSSQPSALLFFSCAFQRGAKRDHLVFVSLRPTLEQRALLVFTRLPQTKKVRDRSLVFL